MALKGLTVFLLTFRVLSSRLDREVELLFLRGAGSSAFDYSFYYVNNTQQITALDSSRPRICRKVGVAPPIQIANLFSPRDNCR